MFRDKIDSDKKKILIVEPETRYIRTLQICLEMAGYQVNVARDGQAALDQIVCRCPDLILIEPMLPVINGFDLCEKIRSFSNVPIVMVTGCTTGKERIHGLECGADDYVTKPFDPNELLARIRAILRRTLTQPVETQLPVFELDSLCVDFVQQMVLVDGVEIQLTATEYRLLVEMIQQANRVLVPSYLLEKIWGAGYESEISLLWQAIHRLRRKIEPDLHHPRYIRTKPGVGYVFVVPDQKKEKTAHTPVY
jgi:DNA-binding response OmpR family regulator